MRPHPIRALPSPHITFNPPTTTTTSTLQLRVILVTLINPYPHRLKKMNSYAIFSYGSHTFKNVNEKGEAVYVKYHFKTDQASEEGGGVLLVCVCHRGEGGAGK